MARMAARISFLTLACIVSFAAPSSAQTRRQTPSRAVATPPQAPPAVSPQSSDLSKLESDALGWLEGLIRINTTNPPGNELVAAKYVADILQHEGITAQIIETTPGRGFLVARLSATAVPDPSRALC